MKKTKHMWPS